MSYCIVNESAGYVYLNIPKAACTSLKLAIAEQAGVEFETLQWNAPWRVPTREAANRYADLYWFTFVRHPAARLVSCWADWCNEPLPSEDNFEMNPAMRKFIGCPFATFADAVCSMSPELMNHHFQPQSDFFRHVLERKPDDVFRVVDINEAWPTIRGRFGLPRLPHARRSEHSPWREYYTEDLLAMVEHRYADDYALGGYSLEAVTC
ncbi:MAG TPA: sulfotransferase family 2 domain-containing protein [Thermoguttaceae bacterium]|nr:sulfotransferase family 2 domain-containing protein [Thermoguttaceae bacterium]